MAKDWSKELQCHKFTWDLATDSGAIGTVSLGNLPENFVVKDLDIRVETALTGGGSVTLGNDGGSADEDGYMTDMDALGVGIHKGVGALIFTAGDTDDFNKPHLVEASADGVVLTIATAAYTAGKVSFYFTGYVADA